jgi:hypothetical protein
LLSSVPELLEDPDGAPAGDGVEDPEPDALDGPLDVEGRGVTLCSCLRRDLFSARVEGQRW